MVHAAGGGVYSTRNRIPAPRPRRAAARAWNQTHHRRMCMSLFRALPIRLLALALPAALALGGAARAADKDKGESIDQLLAILRDKSNTNKQIIAIEKLHDREVSDEVRKEIVTALLDCA